MNPLNIPALLDTAKAYVVQRPTYVDDFAVQCNRFHATLGQANYHKQIFADKYVYAAMVEILLMCAARKWHLGIAMAAVSLPNESLSAIQRIQEAHMHVGLAYGCRDHDEDDVQGPFFLAVAFRHLLNLCAERGLDPATHILRWFGR